MNRDNLYNEVLCALYEQSNKGNGPEVREKLGSLLNLIRNEDNNIRELQHLFNVMLNKTTPDSTFLISYDEIKKEKDIRCISLKITMVALYEMYSIQYHPRSRYKKILNEIKAS